MDSVDVIYKDKTRSPGQGVIQPTRRRRAPQELDATDAYEHNGRIQTWGCVYNVGT